VLFSGGCVEVCSVSQLWVEDGQDFAGDREDGGFLGLSGCLQPLVERGEAGVVRGRGQGCDPSPVKLAQLGQPSHQNRGNVGANPRGSTQTRGQRGQLTIGVYKLCDLLFQRLHLASQGRNMGADLCGYPRVASLQEPVSFLHDALALLHRTPLE